MVPLTTLGILQVNWDHRVEAPRGDQSLRPFGVVLLVELLLDEVRDVLPGVAPFEGLLGAVDGVLLHLLGHFGVLDDDLALTHLGGLLG